MEKKNVKTSALHDEVGALSRQRRASTAIEGACRSSQKAGD